MSAIPYGQGAVSKAALVKIDIPETARQCEAEFKVTFGVDEAGKKYEMQGILNDDNGAIQRLLDRNYVLCRDKVCRPRPLDVLFLYLPLSLLPPQPDTCDRITPKITA